MADGSKLRAAGKAIEGFPAVRVFGEVSYFKANMAVMKGFESVAEQMAADQAQAWERRILDILKTYVQPGRWTTLCVMTEIERAANRNNTCVVIVPLKMRESASGETPEDVLKRHFNAHTYAPDIADGRMADSAKGIKGKGAVAIVEFDPFTWDDGSALVDIARSTMPEDFEPCGMATEDVLFHELVHALRYIQGTVDDHFDEAMWGGYGNREEFIAVLLTNIAISERDPTAHLRRNHGMFTRLPDKLATSDGFLSFAQNPTRLKELYPLEVSLFHNVAGSPYKQAFNPIRAFLNVK